MNRQRILLPLLALCIFLGHPEAQGENGYLRGKRRWDLAYSFSGGVFKEDFGALGGIRDVDRRFENLYLAYGLTDDLDLTAQAIYQRAQFTNLQGLQERENLTDLYLQLKWRVYERELGPGEFHFLLAPGLKTPLQNYETTGFLALGANQTDYLLRTILHYQARTGRWWTSLETGYDRRTSEPPDYLVARLQAGLNAGFVVLIPYFDLFDSRRKASVGEDLNGTFITGGGDYNSFGLKFYVPIGKRAGLTYSLSKIDDNRPTGAIPVFAIGFVIRG